MRLLICLAVLQWSVSCLSYARDIPAENFFATSQQDVDISINSGDTVVFDDARNSRYILNGRNLTINAKSVKVTGDVVIKGFKSDAGNTSGQGSDGSRGANGANKGQCDGRGGDGGAGRKGGTGPRGRNGNTGPDVFLNIGRISGRGLLRINASGQQGGKGGRGGSGGDGGDAGKGGDSKSNAFDCRCGGGDGGNGGRGGNGGKGGIGGDGGSGGSIQITPATERVRQRLNLIVSGGRGGRGGSGGSPGIGGEKGRFGRGSRWCSGGRTGSSGSRGDNGPTGQAGRTGSNGRVTRLNVEIPFPGGDSSDPNEASELVETEAVAVESFTEENAVVVDALANERIPQPILQELKADEPSNLPCEDCEPLDTSESVSANSGDGAGLESRLTALEDQVDEIAKAIRTLLERE